MAIMHHAREAVVVRPLLSVARAVRMVCTRVPPSQRPLHRSSACLTRMSSLSSVARPPRRKSTGTLLIWDRQLPRYYKPLLFAKMRQSWTLRPLKGRINSGRFLARYVILRYLGISWSAENKYCIGFQNIKSPSQDATNPTPAPVPVLPHKLSVSFAAVANGAPDTSKEVSVSA
jgi:hypothetical protein